MPIYTALISRKAGICTALCVNIYRYDSELHLHCIELHSSGQCDILKFNIISNNTCIINIILIWAIIYKHGRRGF